MSKTPKLSKKQREVLIRLFHGDELRAVVTTSSTGQTIGLGVHRFKSDRKPVTLDTLRILCGRYYLAERRAVDGFQEINLTSTAEVMLSTFLLLPEGKF